MRSSFLLLPRGEDKGYDEYVWRFCPKASLSQAEAAFVTAHGVTLSGAEATSLWGNPGPAPDGQLLFQAGSFGSAPMLQPSQSSL